MRKTYMSEIEGMVDFYTEIQITPCYDLNTDGVINATLLEFKKTKSTGGGLLNHKKQIQRYLKAYNSVAKDIPSISLLIYLNSSEYIKIDNKTESIISEGKWNSPIEFKDLLNNNKEFLKGWIDEFSIISYNNKFCKIIEKATKEDVKKEFINPRILYIKPFDWENTLLHEKKSNEIGFLCFNMNQLGNVLLKKQLGAFFTPKQYVEISTRYVINAIERSKKLGYEDYLIIDRCAGTGNLERFLNKEELSHCILNTYDYIEWTTLKGLYDERVRLLIPPTNQYRTSDGLLENGNALTKNFNNYLINYLNKYDLTKTYIILLENPPFRDETSTLSSRDKSSKKSKTFIDELMKNDHKIKGAMKNELSIKFIWSGWNIIKPNEYILYSPIKYWKIYHLCNNKYFDGFITNKKDYNANYNAGLPIINWSNEIVLNQQLLTLENGIIYKINNSIKTLLDKTKYDSYFAKMFIMAGNIRPIGTSLDNGKQVINDTPCLLNESNILNQLPLWVASRYDTRDLELDILMKSGDGGSKYLDDFDFIKRSFIWSCLTIKNKCFSDDKFINEMSLLQNSKCDKILDNFDLDDADKTIIIRWKKILKLIEKCDEYNINLKYGLNQIQKEINIKIWNGNVNKKQEKILEWKYLELNDQIKYLKLELKNYYKEFIFPKCVKFQLIK